MIECQCSCVCCATQVFLLPGDSPPRTLVCPSCSRPLTPQLLRPFEETEWLACSDPALLVQWPGLSDRKLRLFGCACCRLVWGRLPYPRSQKAVEVAEAFADGLADARALAAAHELAVAAVPAPIRWGDPELAAVAVASEPLRVREMTWVGERGRASAIFRDIFGNPFRPVTVDPSWRTGNVVDLARTIYEERCFDRLPILADALMDAGCDNADILDHCRGPGPHVRGCWVVDLILGKE